MDHIALAKLHYKDNNEMITHSEISIKDTKKQIKVYFEKINDKGSDFDTLTYLYPEGKIIENHGYTNEEIEKRVDEFNKWGEIALECEEDRQEDLLSQL